MNDCFKKYYRNMLLKCFETIQSWNPGWKHIHGYFRDLSKVMILSSDCVTKDNEYQIWQSHDQINSRKRIENSNLIKGDSKVRFFGCPGDRRVSVTQPQMDQLTQNITCEDLFGGTFDFCSSQGHMTSTEAKPVLASKCAVPL